MHLAREGESEPTAPDMRIRGAYEPNEDEESGRIFEWSRLADVPRKVNRETPRFWKHLPGLADPASERPFGQVRGRDRREMERETGLEPATLSLEG